MKESKIKKVLLKTALTFVSILLLTLAIFSHNTSEATPNNQVPNYTLGKTATTVNVSRLWNQANNCDVYCIQPKQFFNADDSYTVISKTVVNGNNITVTDYNTTVDNNTRITKYKISEGCKERKVSIDSNKGKTILHEAYILSQTENYATLKSAMDYIDNNDTIDAYGKNMLKSRNL